MLSTRHLSASLTTFSAGLALAACSGGFHSNDGREDMVCDDSGCFHCERGTCEEYRCAETHECPMDRVCSSDGHCLLDGNDDGRCDSHDDCAADEICTLDGECVASPGGGPKGDASDASDTSGDVSEGDTGPGDTTLPEHPDDVCRTSADCGVDGTCVNGGCYFPCDAGRCPPGQACNGDNQCRVAPPENACTYNGECGTNHACLEGTCYQRCAETLDCVAHTRCDAGRCIADTGPVVQCSGAGSCEGNHACVDGKCLAPCVEGACETGFACDVGYCAQVTACFDQADCSGADCVDGACTPQ